MLSEPGADKSSAVVVLQASVVVTGTIVTFAGGVHPAAKKADKTTRVQNRFTLFLPSRNQFGQKQPTYRSQLRPSVLPPVSNKSIIRIGKAW
jgi:hypothetical protein